MILNVSLVWSFVEGLRSIWKVGGMRGQGVAGGAGILELVLIIFTF